MQVSLPSGDSLRVRGSLTLEKVLSIVAHSLRTPANLLEIEKRSPLSKAAPSLLVDQYPVLGLRDYPQFRAVCKADWPSLLALLRKALPAVAPLDATLVQLTSARELQVSVREATSGPPILHVRLSSGDVVDIQQCYLPGGLSASVRALKELIYTVADIPVEMQRIQLRGRTLLDHRRIDSHGVVHGAQLELGLRMRGGTLAGYICIQLDGSCGLSVHYEEVQDPFFDYRDEGKEVAGQLLGTLAADVGGCELRAARPRPKLVRHNKGQRWLTDAVSVWDRAELLALLSVRRIYLEWNPQLQLTTIVDLLLPWLALPPGEWAGNAEVQGRTTRRLEQDVLRLRFEPLFPAERPRQLRLAVPSTEPWPDALFQWSDLMEDFLKACDAATWQLSSAQDSARAKPDPTVAKVGLMLR